MTDPRLRSIPAGLALLLAAATAGAAPPASPDAGAWAGAWGYAPSPPAGTARPTLPAGTYRYRLHLTRPGDAVLVRISDPEEAVPLVVSAVAAQPAKGAQGYNGIGHPVPLTFAGQRGMSLTAGVSATSDPARVSLSAGQDLILTVTTAAPSTDVSGNAGFRETFAPAGAAASELKSRPYVSLVAVHGGGPACTIVTLGDSITEGARNVDTARRGWPDRLADRFAAQAGGDRCGIVNSGISGNRVLTYGRGVAAVNRLERDMTAVPGVTHVILLEGINDIVRSGQPGEHPLTADALIAGYRRVIQVAHARGIKVVGGTLTPAWGYRLMTAGLEGIRAEVNRWIRSSGAFDGVIDFEAAVGDGAAPPRFRADYDSGDHLHPNDAGYRAMAAAVPLATFAR